MTTPSERTRAVQTVEAEILRQARTSPSEEESRRLLLLLRHYPTGFDLLLSAEGLPQVWGVPEKR